MKIPRKSKIAIIGSGFAGCFLAILLAKRGFKVDIYEKALESDVISNASKKTFNITFYKYAADILKKEKLWDKIQSILIRLEDIVSYMAYKENPIMVHLKDEDHNYTIDRARLLQIFIKQAKSYPLITFRFHTKLLSLDIKNKTIKTEDCFSNKQNTVFYDVVFGADGVHSVVRQSIPQEKPKKEIKQYANWTYKQVRFPPNIVASLNLLKNSIYFWVRKAIIIAFPHGDGSYNSIFILPKTKEEGFALLSSASKIEKYVKNYFPMLIPALPVISKSILANPEGYFITIRADKWYLGDFLVLVGDSAHGFSPFYGQGMSAALADAEKIAELIDTYGEKWVKIFPIYQTSIKPNTDIIADLALEKFIKYRRTKKAEKEAIINKIEIILHSVFPQLIIYSLFDLICLDSNKTAYYFNKYKRQRLILNLLGLFIIVRIVMILTSSWEGINFFYKKLLHK